MLSSCLSHRNSVIRCKYFNARSICNKLPDLDVLIKIGQYDLIAVTETWLHDAVPNSLIHPDTDYAIVRKDRIQSKGGGVILLIKADLRFVELNVTNSGCDQLEAVAVDLFIPTKHRVACVYRSPNNDIGYIDLLVKFLKDICEVAWPVTIVGDFNLPNVDWKSYAWPNNPVYDAFMNCVTESALQQLVSFPTRGNNFLDLVFATSTINVPYVECDEYFVNSDHVSLNFALLGNFSTGAYYENSLAFDYNKADFHAIKTFLGGIDWDALLYSVYSVDDKWKLFNDILYSACLQYIPIKHSVPSHKKVNYPAYIRRLISRKQTLWKQSKRSGNFTEYKVHSQKCSKAIFNFRKCQEHRVLNSGDRNKLFKYVNNRCFTKSGISALKTPQGDLVIDDNARSNILAKNFSDVFTVDNGIIPAIQNPPPEINLSWVVFTPVIVNGFMRQMKSKHSHTPDGFSEFFLKQLRDILCFPLSHIFEQSFVNGIVPSAWLSADVIAVYKKGSSSDPLNYRPISLLCICSKLMEKIINCAMLKHLSAADLISKNQHGFLKQRSTVTQLLDCVHDWSISVDAGNCVDVVYIDFAKAFDSVSHQKLLHKISSFGINGQLKHWLASFLKNRKFRVKVNNCFSEYFAVTSGVPQGSILGPLLFVLYINDIAYGLDNVECKIFADDVKLYAHFSSTDQCQSHEFLQNALTKIEEWANRWQLTISAPKCSLLRLGKGFANSADYSLCGITLPAVVQCKDLGVCIHQSLKPSVHCNSIAARAYRVLNILFRCFFTANSTVLLRAYVTYVRPVLEYASPVWSPCYVTDIDLLERVQRSFTRRLYAKCGWVSVPYCQRLQRLDLDSLELRRLHSDLVMVYKIVNRNIDACQYLFTLFDVSYTRGHSKKLAKLSFRTNILKHSFSVRVINAWNALPEIVKNKSLPDARNSKEFLSLLKQVDLGKFLRFDRNL